MSSPTAYDPDVRTEFSSLVGVAAEICSENGFTVSKTAVKEIQEESWGFIWLATDRSEPVTDQQQRDAQSIVEHQFRNSDSELPAHTVSYDTIGQSGVAVWI